MPTDNDGREKPTDDPPTAPLINVEVSRETARKAARLADESNIALEDALARLTAYDYPTDALPTPAGKACSSGRE